MKALIIKKEWLDKILAGEKTWELRLRNTNVRGRIGLIASGSGRIFGVTTLTDAFLASEHQLRTNVEKHCVPTKWRHAYGKNLYAWILKDTVRLKKPRSYAHPQGAVIWVNVPDIAT